MARPSRFSPEVRERALRMVLEHALDHASQWAAITSIAEKIGCAAETLRSWVGQAERDGGRRLGLTTDERARVADRVGCHLDPRFNASGFTTFEQASNPKGRPRIITGPRCES